MVVVAAGPRVGKTAFVLNIAATAAVRGRKHVGICSLEMSGAALVNRLVCAEADVNLHKFNSAFASRDEKQRISAALNDLIRAPLYIDETMYHTPVQIEAAATKLADRKGLDLLIVDYLQLMNGPRKESRQQEVAAISRGLKEAAKRLKIPVIAVSQMNRAAENREEPQLSDLRDSGQIEQDGDVIIFLWNADAGNGAVHPSRGVPAAPVAPDRPAHVQRTALKLAKNRNGPTGVLQMEFNKAFGKFAECAAGREGSSE